MDSDCRLDDRKVFINLLLLETVFKKYFVNFNRLSSWLKKILLHIFSRVDFTKSHSVLLHNIATELTIIILSLLQINSLNHRFIISLIFCLETLYSIFWCLRLKEKWYGTYSGTLKQTIKYCNTNRITNDYIILLNIFYCILQWFSNIVFCFFISFANKYCVVVIWVVDRSTHH